MANWRRLLKHGAHMVWPHDAIGRSEGWEILQSVQTEAVEVSEVGTKVSFSGWK